MAMSQNPGTPVNIPKAFKKDYSGVVTNPKKGTLGFDPLPYNDHCKGRKSQAALPLLFLKGVVPLNESSTFQAKSLFKGSFAQVSVLLNVLSLPKVTVNQGCDLHQIGHHILGGLVGISQGLPWSHRMSMVFIKGHIRTTN